RASVKPRGYAPASRTRTWLTDVKRAWLTGGLIVPLRTPPGAGSDPPLQFPCDHVADHRHAPLGIIEARDVREILPARALEDVRVLHRDLFQRFKTVGGEAGRDHPEILHALLRERLHRCVG